jgi:L-malate glycosyltransferase
MASKRNQLNDSKPVRLLIVAPSFDILGGQAVQADRLLVRLRPEASLEVGFLPINPRLPGLLRWMQSIKYLRTVVTSIAYVALLLARVWKYDVIHIFSASYFSFVLAPTPAILVSKLYGKSVLLNYHSGEAEDHLTRWPSAITTIRMCNEVAVPSAYLVDVFSKFDLHAVPIYNLIEEGKFRFRERNPLRPIFLSNRNFEIHYGVDRVLRAFAIIQKQIPEARLTVAGDGPQRAALEQLARELELRNTEFTGRVPHNKIVELYESADVFLNGSEIDNQPLSILEAFACGLPVVTTDAGGIPYLVTNEESALVVPRGDYEKLAAAALRLFAEQGIAERVTRNGLEECAKYSWQAVRSQWLELYARLARKKSELQTTAAPQQSKVLDR